MNQEQLYRLLALLQIFSDTYKEDTNTVQELVKKEVEQINKESEKQ